MILASPSKRLFAFLIDIFFNSILLIVAVFPFLVFLNPKMIGDILVNFYLFLHTQPLYIVLVIFFFPGSSFLIFIIGIQILFMCKGQTIGKKMFKLQVVDKKNHEHFRFLKMFLRDYIIRPVSIFCWIWVLINDEKKVWYDKIFDSLVIEIE